MEQPPAALTLLLRSLQNLLDEGFVILPRVDPPALVALAGVFLDYPFIYCFGDGVRVDSSSSPPNCLGGIDLKLIHVFLDRKDGSSAYGSPSSR
jgi:hypothetical protein